MYDYLNDEAVKHIEIINNTHIAKDISRGYCFRD
jgi:hypothetical protein